MPASKSKRNFWKIFLTIFILFVIMIGLGVYRALKPSVTIPEKSVLAINLSGSLPDAVLNEEFSNLFSPVPTSLQDIRKCLVDVQSDERIEKVLLNVGPLMTSFAKLEELRFELEQVKSSGKEIWAYVSFPGDKEYYIASCADKIILEPHSALLLDGLKAELLYFKTPLEKIGIAFESSAQGKYKSAIEPLVRETPTEASLEQQNAILDDLYSHYVSTVSRSRNISQERYEEILNTELLILDDKAIQLGLVDTVAFLKNVKDKLKNQIRLYDEDENVFVSVRNYIASKEDGFGASSDYEIAVINIQGEMVDMAEGFDERSKSGLNEIIDAIEAIGENERVRALVVRIDSPGGSGIAAAKMLNALDFVKSKKPIVASMSGQAASGGYWVAMNANRIVANSMSLTGSIGVFSIKPYIKLLQEKIGLNRVVLKRGKLADAFNSFDKLPPKAYEKYDAFLADFYDEFLKNVSFYREMPLDSVKEVAQGRVWTGKRAVENGLVDELGGLSVALEIAKNLSDIPLEEPYQMVTYPKQKDFFEQLFSEEFFSYAMSMNVSDLKKELTQNLFRAMFGSGYTQLPIASQEPLQTILDEALGLKPLTWVPYTIEVE